MKITVISTTIRLFQSLQMENFKCNRCYWSKASQRQSVLLYDSYLPACVLCLFTVHAQNNLFSVHPHLYLLVYLSAYLFVCSSLCLSVNIFFAGLIWSCFVWFSVGCDPVLCGLIWIHAIKWATIDGFLGNINLIW